MNDGVRPTNVNQSEMRARKSLREILGLRSKREVQQDEELAKVHDKWQRGLSADRGIFRDETGKDVGMRHYR